MNRHVHKALVLMVVASLTAAIGALLWRWREAGDIAAILAGPKPFRPAMLLAMPAVLAGLLAFADHAQSDHRPSRYEAGFVGLTLVSHFVLLLALQAWMTLTYLDIASLDREFVVRLAVAFLGLAMAVRGNVFAKRPAPGDDVEGDWGRATRGVGCGMVLLGLALTACGVALPMPGMLAALGCAFASVAALSAVQRRASAQL